MIPENYTLFELHEEKMQRELEKLPECSDCGEKIQDSEAYYINDEWICENCMDCYKKEVCPDF